MTRDAADLSCSSARLPLVGRETFGEIVRRAQELLYSCAGEVSEWLKVPLSKSGVVMSHRGFESHPLRPQRRRAQDNLEGSHSLA